MRKCKSPIQLTVEDSSSGRHITVGGRNAWMLRQLIEAGPRGVTPIEQPAPRMSEYVRFLRHDCGISIETVDEKHAGSFPCRHGRYVLRSNLTIVRDGSVQA